LRPKLVIAVALVGCGGLDNRPLRSGAVQGQVMNCEPSVAVVGIVGSSSSTAVDSACHFRIDDVPVGQAQLFVVATPGTALSQTITVEAASVLDLGELHAPHAATLHVKVQAPARQVVSGELLVPGVPLAAQPIDMGGNVSAGPFPDGCWSVTVDAAGLGQLEQMACFTGGADMSLDVTMPKPDGTKGKEGCSVSGCQAQSVCMPDGSCT
jgi:hypothetical protein